MATTTTSNEDTANLRTNASDVQVGDVFTRFSSGIVREVSFNSIIVSNSEGKEWKIDKAIVEAEFNFSGHVQKEESVSRTDAIEILKSNPKIAMQIKFTKKPEGKSVAVLLKEGQGDKTDRAWVREVNAAIKGEERILNGHHTNSWTPHGRLYFSCFGDTTGVRQVDPRTIEYIIVGNQKFKVK